MIFGSLHFSSRQPFLRFNLGTAYIAEFADPHTRNLKLASPTYANVEQGSYSMEFFKKEWKAILITLWLIIITVFLSRIDGQLDQLNAKNTKIASTLDAVESVVISTDSSVVQMSKKVGDMDSNVAFIVQKIRRR